MDSRIKLRIVFWQKNDINNAEEQIRNEMEDVLWNVWLK
jgi:hypothetical protein